MKSFNLFEWLTKRRIGLYPKIEAEFHCVVCKHRFKRNLRRLYIDLNTLDQRQQQSRSPRQSEFVVPERIVCPKCKAVDQFKLGASIYQHLTQTILIASNGIANPYSPIQCLRFTLPDGQSMHPLRALKLYARQVAEQPEDIALRLEYANTLRMLGYHEEAEAEYHAVLDREPIEPEASLNLAVLHGKRQEKEIAVKYLLQIIDTAEYSPHPNHDIIAEAAQMIADGEIKMDEIELTAPALFDINQAGERSSSGSQEDKKSK
jgi:tetratricopeptide (TPR) repeat protein